jgi:hypothetical protein
MLLAWAAGSVVGVLGMLIAAPRSPRTQ